MSARSSLFDPLPVGPLSLKNRVVMAPMTTLHERLGPGALESFCEARARGGVAVVFINLQALPGGPERADSRPLSLADDRDHDRLAALAARIHAHDGLAGVQLGIGPWWMGARGEGPRRPLSPSGRKPAGVGIRPDVASLPFFPDAVASAVGDLMRVPDAVAAAARRAIAAGFDVVQVSGAGGSLPAQFLSPMLNRRSDGYGGPLEHRARVLLEVVRGVRAEVPRGRALTCRINGDDGLPGGMAADDYAPLVPWLEAAGVDAIDVLPGGFVAASGVPDATAAPGAWLPVSARLRRAARVPVSAGGRLGNPDVAGQAIRSGHADYVSLGTALIADPDWVSKARQAPGLVRACPAGCTQCWDDLLIRHRPVTCRVNASVGTFAATP